MPSSHADSVAIDDVLGDERNGSSAAVRLSDDFQLVDAGFGLTQADFRLARARVFGSAARGKGASSVARRSLKLGGG